MQESWKHPLIPLKTPQQIDPERLAALIDGRLSPSEAAAVRAQLASVDESVQSAFADAVALSRDSQAEGNPPLQLARRRRWRRALPAIPMLAAAAAVFFFVKRSAPETEAYQPGMLAAALPASVSAPATLPWTATRGHDSETADRAIAVRIGVLLVDLELAALRGDTNMTAAFGMAALLQPLPGATAIANEFRQYAGAAGSGTDALQRRRMGLEATRVSDSTLVALGAYIEAARLAAASGDSSFFMGARNPLPEVGTSVDDSTQAQLTRLRAATSALPVPMNEVAALLNQLLHSLAS